MKYISLSEKEVENILINLPEWQHLPDVPALYSEFTFPSFLQAIEFMYNARIFIDTLNHHPEWANVYNKVKITLYTHDIKAITETDIELAKYLTDLYRKL